MLLSPAPAGLFFGCNRSLPLNINGRARALARGASAITPHWRIPMSKKAAQHHKNASEHHTHAAKHHGEAAMHHEAGRHEKAAHHAHTARAHAIQATEHAENAAKAHGEEHGKK